MPVDSNARNPREKSSYHFIKQFQETLDTTKENATRDLLTGIYNRAYFEEQVRIIEADNRSQEPITVLFMDIVNMKGINDNRIPNPVLNNHAGHAAGDEAIRRVARALWENVRDKDTVARIGGDEFIGLFPNAGNSEEVELLVSRLQSVLDKTGIPVTIGHATATRKPDNSIDLQSAIKAADADFYQKKPISQTSSSPD